MLWGRRQHNEIGFAPKRVTNNLHQPNGDKSCLVRQDWVGWRRIEFVLPPPGSAALPKQRPYHEGQVRIWGNVLNMILA